MNDIQLAQVEAGEAAVVERLRAKGLLPPKPAHLYPGVWFQSATSKKWYEADPDVEGGIAAVRIGDQVFVAAVGCSS